MSPYTESVAVYNLLAARQRAAIVVAGKMLADRGRSPAQFAEICVAGGYELATRNVKDFINTASLVVVDPFLRQ